MKCPYCAEEIKDEAIVCRYCSRDFALFLPLLNRVAKLESEISEMGLVVDHLASKPSASVQSRSDFRSFLLAVLCGIAAAAANHGALWITRELPPWTLWLVTLSAVPIPFLFGVFRPNAGWKVYLTEAMVQSSVTFVWSVLLYAHRDGLSNVPWLSATEIFGVAPAIFGFLSAGLGSRLGGGKHSTSHGYAESIAEALVPHRHQQSRAADVQKFASFISAISPVLVLIGTLISATFGLIGVLYKGK